MKRLAGMAVAAAIMGTVYYFDRSPIVAIAGLLVLVSCWAAMRGPSWD